MNKKRKQSISAMIKTKPFATQVYSHLKKIRFQELLWIFSELALTIWIATRFGLPQQSILILFITTIALTPMFFRYQLQWIKQEQAFFNLTDFLQQFIASFKSHPKIYAALLECEDITQHQLHKDVRFWIEGLEKGGYPQEHAKAFMSKYGHFTIGNMVHLMLAVENYGSFHYAEGFEIIQDDIEEWIEDTYAFKQEQIQTQRKIQILSLFSMGIAYMSHNMLFKSDMVSELGFYHTSLLLFFGLILLTLFFAQKMIAVPWIEKKELIWNA